MSSAHRGNITLLRSWPAHCRQFLHYVLAGGTATLLNIGTYLVILEAGIWYMAAHVMSEAVGFVSAFLLQKYLVFKKHDNGASHFVRYCLLALFNVCASTVMLYLFVEYLHFDQGAAKFIVLGMVVLWNFFLYKFFVYA